MFDLTPSSLAYHFFIKLKGKFGFLFKSYLTVWVLVSQKHYLQIPYSVSGFKIPFYVQMLPLRFIDCIKQITMSLWHLTQKPKIDSKVTCSVKTPTPKGKFAVLAVSHLPLALILSRHKVLRVLSHCRVIGSHGRWGKVRLKITFRADA